MTPTSVIAEAHHSVDRFEQAYGNRHKDYVIACFNARRALDEVTPVNTSIQQRSLVEAALRSLSVKHERFAPGVVTILSWFLQSTRPLIQGKGALALVTTTPEEIDADEFFL